jgi:hypothetical protein
VHPGDASGAFERLRAAAPLPVPRPEAADVHVEVLNWLEVARAVHPKIHHPPPVPSPFAYLPSTPQELLRAYLEVVGVRPADCYSAQATVDEPRALLQGGMFTTNLGPKQRCADGVDRMRTRGCEQVVVVYRDREEYAQGRRRWDDYQGEVLQAHLERGLRLRPPVEIDDLSDIGSAFLRTAIRASALLDRLDEIGMEKLPPYRYCWPPADDPR